MYQEIEAIFFNFRNGKKPPEENFRDWLDSYVHKSEMPPPFGPYAGNLYTYRPPNVILMIDGIYQANKITSGLFKIDDWTKIWDRPTSGQAEITDYIVSIKKGLLPKEPVDHYVGTNVDFETNNFTGTDGKRYALGGQKDKTQNGVYTWIEGSGFVPTPEAGYFTQYGPGSVFMDKSTGNIWFKPITKNNTNVTDPETGIRPSEGFDFYRLDRAMLDISILDAFPMCGVAKMEEEDSTWYAAIFPRLLPAPYIEEMIIGYAKTDQSMLGTSFGIDASSKTSLGFRILSNAVIEDATERMDWTARASDAYLKDLILQYLTPEPVAGYYGSSGEVEVLINEITFYSDALSEADLNTVLGTEVDDYELAGDGLSISFSVPGNSFSIPDGGLDSDGFFRGNSNIKGLNLPGCIEVGQLAFQNCDGLQQVLLDNCLTLNNGTFGGCTSLVTISAPLLTSLVDSVFLNCTSLTSADFPSVTALAGSNTFTGCVSLTTVDLPLCTSIGVEAFSGPVGLTAITSINLPLCVDFGGTTGGDAVFDGSIDLSACTLTVPVSLQTCNSGSPDGDIVFYESCGGTINYV